MLEQGFFGAPSIRKEWERQIPPPVGEHCIFCREPIVATDSGTVNMAGQVSHYACQLRQVVGSVGHQLHLCSCYGGTQEDPEGMSHRQAAELAMKLHHALSLNLPTRVIRREGEGGKSVECLRCGSVSYNPSDVAYEYCGNCKVFHATPP